VIFIRGLLRKFYLIRDSLVLGRLATQMTASRHLVAFGAVLAGEEHLAIAQDQASPPCRSIDQAHARERFEKVDDTKVATGVEPETATGEVPFSVIVAPSILLETAVVIFEARVIDLDVKRNVAP
jgi:hypothetical protein